MFVDASAMVAIITEESGFESLVPHLDGSSGCITSAIAIWETTVRLTTKWKRPVPDASATVDQFRVSMGISLVEIGVEESRIALAAFDRFGKGRHPARLNMGDCFAYACAKVHRVPLLYVGNDFALTDVNDGF
jgi:ribonuclease VapC